MFSEVYWHHAVRAATSMFARAVYELQDRLDFDRLFTETDAGMIAALRERAVATSAAPLLDGVFGSRRRLYKRVAEYAHDRDRPLFAHLSGRPYAQTVRCSDALVRLVSKRRGQPLDPCAILIDAPPRQREIEFEIDVYYPRRNEYRSLQDVSPVVDALARTQFDDYAKRVRVFCDPSLAGEIAAMPDFDNILEQAAALLEP
jgi:HD superfamily phosphohydrolase